MLITFFFVLQVLTEADGRVRVETTKGHCVFTIECAERQDEGVYSVVVRNPAGEDTADINVKVVGERPLATGDTTTSFYGAAEVLYRR